MGTTAQRYVSALFPDIFRVLGKPLQAYTLGHAMLLQRLDNPIVVGGRNPALGDLAQFIAICRRSYPSALRMVSADWRARLALWRARPHPVYAGKAFYQIGKYLRASSSMPKRWENEDGAPIGTPFLQQVKLTLMMNLGKSELQALCTPFALAMWDACGCWEMEGRIRLADEDSLAEARRVIEEAKRSKWMKDG